MADEPPLTTGVVPILVATGCVLTVAVIACVPEPPTSPDATPGVPTGLAATPEDSVRIDLTWSPPADGDVDVASYRLYRDGELVAEPDRTTYSDGALAPYTRYEYRVSALSEGEVEGERSDSVVARTLDGSPPHVPSDLGAEGVSSTRIDLTWTAASDPESGVVEYVIYRDGTRAATSRETSFSDTGLEPVTSHSYEIAAVNGAGLEGPKSDRASAETKPDGTPPTEPENLSGEATGPASVELTWDAASDPESGVSVYRVYRDGDRIVETSGTSHRDEGLAPSRRYEYEVSAVNGEGLEGSRAGPVSVVTEPDDTPPTPPSDLEAEGEGPTTVELSWDAASDPESGISAYRIYRDDIRIVETGGTSFEDTGLTSSTTYSYEVAAVNGDGLEGERAGPVSVETDPDETPPTEPEDLSGEATGPASVELTWDAASDPESGVSSYRVYRNGRRVGSSSNGSYRDTGLTSSTTYRYEVTAVNGEDMEGDAAGPVFVETNPDETPPTVPDDLEAEARGTERIRLDWEPSTDPESGVAFYQVYRDSELVARVEETGYVDEELEEETTYSYRVSAVNGDGYESALSAPVEVTTAGEDDALAAAAWGHRRSPVPARSAGAGALPDARGTRRFLVPQF